MNTDICLMDRNCLSEEVQRLRQTIRAFCETSEAKLLPETRKLSSLLPEGLSKPPKLPTWEQLLTVRSADAR